MNHFKLSMIKSGFRIAAAAFLILHCYSTTAILFIVAEIFGILEEVLNK